MNFTYLISISARVHDEPTVPMPISYVNREGVPYAVFQTDLRPMKQWLSQNPFPKCPYYRTRLS